ncbi:hypothetical protein ABEQ76_16020 [Bacillus velezensis]|uniref:hypothetical protein n=1 Tax=Bacillus velezensis TaxID=492670 RepID=UPI003F6E32D7
MRAQEMIQIIRQAEHNLHGIPFMDKSRIKYFQRKNWDIMKGVEYDSSFYAFVRELKQVMGSNIAEITAKKILNNWYLWAEDNIKSLEQIQPFEFSADAIDFLINNNFRVDHKTFSELAKDPIAITSMKDKMPKDSILFLKLKTVADHAYPSPRGFTYEYLVKVVAGFSTSWNQNAVTEKENQKRGH